MVSSGSEMVGFTQKVQRTEDGRVFGSCGASVDCAMFAKWMQGAGERPELSDDFAALVLKGSKVFYLCRKLEPIEFILPQAIGSGSDYALGAMLAGKTPHEAVEIACMRDTRSGGLITSLEAIDDK